MLCAPRHQGIIITIIMGPTRTHTHEKKLKRRRRKKKKKPREFPFVRRSGGVITSVLSRDKGHMKGKSVCIGIEDPRATNRSNNTPGTSRGAYNAPGYS